MSIGITQILMKPQQVKLSYARYVWCEKPLCWTYPECINKILVEREWNSIMHLEFGELLKSLRELYHFTEINQIPLDLIG